MLVILANTIVLIVVIESLLDIDVIHVEVASRILNEISNNCY